MADSRVAGRAPLRILCQHERGSCAACCGVYNFRDRSDEAEHARLVRRTELVRAAWPDQAALARVRDELLALEAPNVLFAGVKVCPFAGYLDDERVGCLLHPSRHPSGADLRDVGVYPKEICGGHFCAPHDWLRAREADLATTAHGIFYGRVVTDAGLLKALARLLDDALGRAFRGDELARAQPALDALWAELRDWPWRDPDAARFGGFVFVGNEATERSVPSCLAGLEVTVAPAARAVLDALGTRPLDEAEARAALGRLDELVRAVATADSGDDPRGSMRSMSTADPPTTPAAPPTLRLDHFLKREALVGSGGSAKQAIQSGLVLVNGQVETRRKRQLAPGDVVRFEGRERTVGALAPRS